MILDSMELHGRSGHEAGRILLAQLYRREIGEAMPPIEITPLGKPYFPGSPWHFSISHTRSRVFCVLSRKNVGMDAEELTREVKPSLAAKILSPEEKLRYEAAPDKPRALLAFWVLKEAEAKLTGKGLRLYPNHTNFDPADPRVREMEGCLVAVLHDA